MTNKQIIVDGVDVSGCKHFKIGTCLADYLLTDMDFSEAKCELCKDCYFKQLTRKTQECEELRIKNNILKEHNRYYKNESKRYKKEIGGLKAEKEQAEQKLKRDNKTMLDFLEAYYVDRENEGTFDRIEEIIKQVKGQKS